MQEFIGKIDLIRRIPHQLLPEKERLKYTVEDINIGGFIQIGAEYYLIEAKHRYEEAYKKQKWVWYELQLTRISDGKQFFLEYERDDKLEMSFWEMCESLSDVGLTKQMLNQFDDDEEGQFRFQNTSFEYEDSGDVTFYRNNGSDGDEYYFWDFKETGHGKRLISVEKWDNNDFEISTGYKLNTNEVAILALGGESDEK